MKPLKRLETYFSALFTLGRVKVMAKQAHRALPRLDTQEARIAQQDAGIADHAEQITHLGRRLDRVGEDMRAMQASLDVREKHLGDIDRWLDATAERMQRYDTLAEDTRADYRQEVAVLNRLTRSDHALLARMFSDISRRLDGGAGAPQDRPVKTGLPASEGFGLFQRSLRDRMAAQGGETPEEATYRRRAYLPDVEAAWIRTGQKPVMDLRAGAGGWLALLAQADIAGFGVDNETAGKPAEGLDLRQGDPLEALAAQPDASLSVLSALHLVERLPFDAVAWLVREAGRVLAPGGLLLLETPNAGNLAVAAGGFHSDPARRNPLPEDLLRLLLDTAGFDPVRIRGVNPDPRLSQVLDGPHADAPTTLMLFGPRDLAVLGLRPEDG